MTFPIDNIHRKFDKDNNDDVNAMKSVCEEFGRWYFKQPEDKDMPYDIYVAKCRCESILRIPPNPDTRSEVMKYFYRQNTELTNPLSFEKYNEIQDTYKTRIKYKNSLSDINFLLADGPRCYRNVDSEQFYLKNSKLPVDILYRMMYGGCP